jgi:hypothetical protein
MASTKQKERVLAMSSRWMRLGMALVIFALIIAGFHMAKLMAQTPVIITVSPDVPTELNPPFNASASPSGGAPSATPEQAASFAWQEFIALNWPAGPQQGKPNQREAPSQSCRFADPNCTGPTVWQTFRGKVEIFPGPGNKPPGYPGVVSNDPSFGYDALPQYQYQYPGNTCDATQSSDQTPWVNLDETDQITLDSMYAGVVSPDSSPGNSAPQLIRFMAKANRKEYVYVARNSSPTDPLNQWWSAIPSSIVAATKSYLTKNQASPPSGSSEYVSQPDGTIETKAAWRPLNQSEVGSGRFHMQRVRFYEHVPNSPETSYCYRDATWGLVALHIIQKTPSAPYFIYATFEQADNILTADGKPVEDADGNVLPSAPVAATTPQVCLQDPRPTQGKDLAMVIVTLDPKTCLPIRNPSFCDSPGKELFYRNENVAMVNPPPAPVDGNICVNRRDNDIPQYAIDTNKRAHDAIKAYLQKNTLTTAPWLYYKLVNVQYYPYDKTINTVTPNGSLYKSQPPYTAKNPAPSSFYQANIVVETNRALQLFSGALTYPPGNGVSTDWNADGTPHKNTYYRGAFYNAGGCLGCHGSQGQIPRGQAGDFSVILARGSVAAPEYPATITAHGLSKVPRNRSLR